MTTGDTPQCIASPSAKRDDNFLINEYLIRNGFYERIETLKAENKRLECENKRMARQLSQVDRKIETLEEETRRARIRCTAAEDKLKDITREADKQLGAAAAREAQLIHMNQKLENELSKLRQRLGAVAEVNVPCTIVTSRPSRVTTPRMSISKSETPRELTCLDETPVSHSDTTAVLSPNTIMKGLSIIVPDGPDEPFSPN